HPSGDAANNRHVHFSYAPGRAPQMVRQSLDLSPIRCESAGLNCHALQLKSRRALPSRQLEKYAPPSRAANLAFLPRHNPPPLLPLSQPNTLHLSAQILLFPAKLATPNLANLSHPLDAVLANRPKTSRRTTTTPDRRMSFPAPDPKREPFSPHQPFLLSQRVRPAQRQQQGHHNPSLNPP